MGTDAEKSEDGSAMQREEGARGPRLRRPPSGLGQPLPMLVRMPTPNGA